jgi:transcriptional regulator with XRE-family HTH domain
MLIGKQFASARLAQGLSISELSRLSGVDRKTIMDFEGEDRGQLTTLKKLAAHLPVLPYLVLQENGAPSPDAVDVPRVRQLAVEAIATLGSMLGALDGPGRARVELQAPPPASERINRGLQVSPEFAAAHQPAEPAARKRGRPPSKKS